MRCAPWLLSLACLGLAACDADSTFDARLTARALEIGRAPAGSTVYYATFERGSGGFRFPLHAVELGGERWRAEVCGPDRQILGGQGYLSVEIVVLGVPAPAASPGVMRPPPKSTGIAVFTAESHGVALDFFDPKSGARTLAWSSDLWFTR